jgi:hypothetical protein
MCKRSLVGVSPRFFLWSIIHKYKAPSKFPTQQVIAILLLKESIKKPPHHGVYAPHPT